MWTIISDNLTAVNILKLCREQNESDDYKSNYLFHQYLYALILWEAIYRSPSRTSSSIYDTAIMENAKQEPFLRNVANTIHKLPYEYFDLDIVYSHIYNKINIIKHDNSTADAAVYYLALGQVANMNIMLSSERAEFIHCSGISSKLWSRECILEYVDKEVFDIYRNVNSFFKHDIVQFQTPLLVDYICQNATCLRDAIEIALELRETPEIIHFRETMDRIDNSINEGNVLLINYLKQQLDDIIEQFIRKEIPTEKTSLSFSITPSFTAPTFSVEFGIPTGSKTSKHRINLNFITNLVKHGLTKTYRGDLNI